MTPLIAFGFDPQAGIAALLLSLRVATLLLFTPLWVIEKLPLPIRFVLVATFSLALAGGISPHAMAQIDTSVGGLLLAVLCECALGAVLALGVQVALAACTLAGHLLDIQIGFGIAQVFDPQSRRQMSLLTGVFNQLGMAAFFMFEATHALLRAVAASVQAFPLGQPWPLGGVCH